MYNNKRMHGFAYFNYADCIVFLVSLFAYRVQRLLWQNMINLKHSIMYLVTASELNIIWHWIVHAAFWPSGPWAHWVTKLPKLLILIHRNMIISLRS